MTNNKITVYNGSGDSAIATISTLCRRILRRIRILNFTINSSTFHNCESTVKRTFLRKRKILRIKLRNLKTRRLRLLRLQEARVNLRRLDNEFVNLTSTNMIT